MFTNGEGIKSCHKNGIVSICIGTGSAEALGRIVRSHEYVLVVFLSFRRQAFGFAG